MSSTHHPTHALHIIDNWDGEHECYTSLAYRQNDIFYNFETMIEVLTHVGDDILFTWELKPPEKP